MLLLLAKKTLGRQKKSLKNFPSKYFSKTVGVLPKTKENLTCLSFIIPNTYIITMTFPICKLSTCKEILERQNKFSQKFLFKKCFQIRLVSFQDKRKSEKKILSRISLQNMFQRRLVSFQNKRKSNLPQRLHWILTFPFLDNLCASYLLSTRMSISILT